MEKIILKMIDKSIVLGNLISENDKIIHIDSPMALTSIPNPQTGQMDIGLVPMDMVFSEASVGKNNVELKQEHIMWKKDMTDFPNYVNFFIQNTTGIETAGSGSGIIQ